MKIFTTGGTGFIGSHFVQAAITSGHEVIALRRPGSQPRRLLKEQPKWIDGALDGCKFDVRRHAQGDMGCVFHGGNTDVDRPVTMI